MKKNIIKNFLCLSLLIASSSTIFSSTVLANESNKNNDVIQQQLEDFASFDKEIKENGLEKDPKNLSGGKSTYPTRKGVILVTKDGSFGELIGHAGIIYNASTTVESFPNGGVKEYSNDWDTRYDTVYGATVRNSSTYEDAGAANFAHSYIGKPYNWLFTNINTTSKFYCSQLVYRSFLDATNINLNQGGGIVFPIDLIQSNETSTFYTKGI